jgi:hypothetical protein
MFHVLRWVTDRVVFGAYIYMCTRVREAQPCKGKMLHTIVYKKSSTGIYPSFAI